jgi:hypothetical protein
VPTGRGEHQVAVDVRHSVDVWIRFEEEEARRGLRRPAVLDYVSRVAHRTQLGVECLELAHLDGSDARESQPIQDRLCRVVHAHDAKVERLT